MTDRAFTYIEVLASVLVLAIGMLAAIGLVRYGIGLARKAQATALAEPTAHSLMADCVLLGVPAGDFNKTGSDTWEGYVNGLWCKRTVSDKDVQGGMTMATVTVEVYWSGEAQRVTTLRERMIFHAP